MKIAVLANLKAGGGGKAAAVLQKIAGAWSAHELLAAAGFGGEQLSRCILPEEAEGYVPRLNAAVKALLSAGPDLLVTVGGDGAAAYAAECLIAEGSKVPLLGIGAGTANVEFEAMTGISARFFGPGEYPHKSVLTEKTCESIPYDLKQIGYTTHAIHNHRGAFYNRNIVFKNLGFDTFTCLEYMHDVVKTPKNWAKDGVLTENIIDALDSSKGKDYIYTISVQGHGKYPDEEVLTDPQIKVTKAPTEEKKWAYEYFANQMYEMDIFLKDLTKTLKNYDEDIVLVIYGDHLPALDMTEEELKTGDLYKTQYVIWSNYGLRMRDRDTYSYEIGPQLLKRLGIDTGMLNKYHQNHSKDKNYKKGLEALSYDILYGKEYIYGGKNPYEPSDMKMGVKPIKIDEIVQIGDKYYIKGQNFTEFSKISLDGEVLKTVYLGPNILALNEEVNPDDVDKMKVSQVEKNKEILSTTE